MISAHVKKWIAYLKLCHAYTCCESIICNRDQCAQVGICHRSISHRSGRENGHKTFMSLLLFKYLDMLAWVKDINKDILFSIEMINQLIDLLMDWMNGFSNYFDNQLVV